MINEALYALGFDGGWKIKNQRLHTWYRAEPQPTEEQIQAKIAELTAAEPLRLLRLERNQLLAETDWRATVDYPKDDQAEWLTYRQALRDITTQVPELDEQGNLVGITWPTPPETN